MLSGDTDEGMRSVYPASENGKSHAAHVGDKAIKSKACSNFLGERCV